MIIYDETPYYIGTAGYKHDDWIGNFYPRGISNEDMLGHYSKDRGLKFLELTFSFYTDPTADITYNIADNSAEDLTFSVRLAKRFLKEVPTAFDAGRFKGGLDPIYDRVKAYFADFFNGFMPSRANLDFLAGLRDRFSDKPFFVELAHRGWFREKYVEELRKLGVGVVISDFPRKSGLSKYTVNAFERNAYFRLYGNSPKWTSPAERSLDYEYKEAELARFLKDASAMSAIADNVFISFCNSTNGYAARNALQMRNMIKDKISE